jgi:hypothetical protein
VALFQQQTAKSAIRLVSIRVAFLPPLFLSIQHDRTEPVCFSGGSRCLDGDAITIVFIIMVAGKVPFVDKLIVT